MEHSLHPGTGTPSAFCLDATAVCQTRRELQTKRTPPQGASFTPRTALKRGREDDDEDGTTAELSVAAAGDASTPETGAAKRRASGSSPTSIHNKPAIAIPPSNATSIPTANGAAFTPGDLSRALSRAIFPTTVIAVAAQSIPAADSTPPDVNFATAGSVSTPGQPSTNGFAEADDIDEPGERLGYPVWLSGSPLSSVSPASSCPSSPLLSAAVTREDEGKDVGVEEDELDADEEWTRKQPRSGALCKPGEGHALADTASSKPKRPRTVYVPVLNEDQARGPITPHEYERRLREKDHAIRAMERRYGEECGLLQDKYLELVKKGAPTNKEKGVKTAERGNNPRLTATLEKKLMDRDARIQALDRKLDDMAKATRTAVSNACSNLQQQHDDLMKKYAALTKTLDDRVRQQDALQRSHAELAEREADIRTEHEELKRKHVEACRRAEDCQKMYDDRTRIVKVLSGEIEDLTRAKAEIAAALEQAADCDLPDRHDELTREHEELRGMFDVLTRDHEKLKHGLMDALRMEPGEVLQTGDLVLRACLMKSETAEVAKQRDELERAAAALASELADVKFTSAQFEDIERTQEVVLGGVIQEELKVREELKALKKTYDTHVSTSASSARDSASLLAKKDDDLRRLRERVARDTAFVEEGFTELKNRRVELAQRHAELGKRHAELVKGHARVVEERDALAREVETIERAFEAGAYLVYPET